MAVKSIYPKKDAVSHSATVDGRSYSVELIAEVTDLSTGPVAIRDWLAAAGFTAGAHYQYPLGTPTEQDYGSYLQGLQITPNSACGRQYKVVLEYKSIDLINDGPANGTQVNNWVMSPTSAPPSLRWASEDVEFALTHDREGKPILNAAGDPYDPPLVEPLPTPVAYVSRVEPTFKKSWITLFKNTTNAAPWMGFPAESVLCRDITADRTYSPDHGKLWTVNYTFAFRPVVLATDDETVLVAGWDIQVLNAGKRELKLRPPLTTPIRVPIYLEGSPTPDPVPLQLDGSYDPEGEPVYLRFAVKHARDFSFFNMPADLFEE